VMDRPATWPPGRVRLPGLDPDARYRLTPVGPDAGAEPLEGSAGRPAWQYGGQVHSGRALATIGVPAPALQPDHAALLHLERG
jgi:alpha-galactosidase